MAAWSNSFLVATGISYISLIALAFSITIASVDAHLKLVQIVHRHGDRNPISFYPNDPNKGSSLFMEDGLGELQIRGKLRMYQLGAKLRKKYEQYLTDNPREVQVRSSASDRAIESTSCLMSGLYPAQGRWQFIKDFNWQPFPIKTVPNAEDSMLYPDSYCPKADAEAKIIMDSDEFKGFIKQEAKLLDFIARNGGFKGQMSLKDAEHTYDAISIEHESYGLPLPGWVAPEVYSQMSRVADKTFYFDFATETMQKLRAGVVLNQILTNMENVTSNTKDKIFVYSSHDTLVAAILRATGTFNQLKPPFGATLIFELHKNHNASHAHAHTIAKRHDGMESMDHDEMHTDENDYHHHESAESGSMSSVPNGDDLVDIYYLNVTDSTDYFKLALPNCTDPCTLTKLRGALAHMILSPDDWKQECGLSLHADDGPALSMFDYALFVIFISFALIATLLVSHWIKIAFPTKLKHGGGPKDNHKYSLLPLTTHAANH